MAHNPEAIRLMLNIRIDRLTVDDGEHLIYTGMVNDVGTPIINEPMGDGRNLMVRRVVFEQAVRPLVDGERVFSTCGVQSCIKSEHLVALAHNRRKVKAQS